MDKKEFSETKTIISDDGKTVTTVTVSGSSSGDTSASSSTVTTSVTTTVTSERNSTKD